MQIRNRQPWAVEIAAPNHDFYADVEAGGTVEVSDELGASLLDQPDNWEAVTKSAKGKE